MSKNSKTMRTIPGGDVAASTASTAPAAPAPTAAPDVAPRRRGKAEDKVRTTVVLDRTEYDRVQRFCQDISIAAGRAGVASSEVVRVLLELIDDTTIGPDLRRRVTERVAVNGGNRRGRTP